jgi:hypothetical protein
VIEKSSETLYEPPEATPKRHILGGTLNMAIWFEFAPLFAITVVAVGEETWVLSANKDPSL